MLLTCLAGWLYGGLLPGSEGCGQPRDRGAVRVGRTRELDGATLVLGKRQQMQGWPLSQAE